MIPLPEPTFNVREVFLACISKVEDKELKGKYEACVDLLENAESDFIAKFKKHEIHEIQRNLNITADINKDLMIKVYTYRMLSSKQPGRIYYDKILSSAPFGKCPYCSLRNADTVDHYLPKANYPIFSVTPITLVPCCTLCQDKLIPYPNNDEEQTLHPYFDDVENDNWISAVVCKTNPITFTYEVAPPSEWPDILKKRLINHFNSYNLDALFSSHANEEFRGRKKYMSTLHSLEPQLLTHYLGDSYDSYLELGLNSWQAVMYKSLINDKWFHKVGIHYD